MFSGVSYWSEGRFFKLLDPVSMPGCLALRTGSLLMDVFHQRASEMYHAKSVSQAGLSSFRQILAAVFQTVMIYRLQESLVGHGGRRACFPFWTRRGEQHN
eukprot:1161972-Pelagomonas_calceolata.AAC.13